ncbi:unnamed protein product [Rotaria sordida]|nr:unnamed protein product [Rotaria sordida]CAF1533720.1 unnamed protein product [Rotaria sordida]
MTGGGMCADTVMSCKDLVSCENDNKTCSVPNTVCVNNTRCNIPVCYPIDRASFQRCPSLALRTLTNTTAPRTVETTSFTTPIATMSSTPRLSTTTTTYTALSN